MGTISRVYTTINTVPRCGTLHLFTSKTASKGDRFVPRMTHIRLCGAEYASRSPSRRSGHTRLYVGSRRAAPSESTSNRLRRADLLPSSRVRFLAETCTSCSRSLRPPVGDGDLGALREVSRTLSSRVRFFPVFRLFEGRIGNSSQELPDSSCRG